MSVEVVKCQRGSQSLENIGVQGKTINALEQGLDVGRALFLLLWGGLFDRPLHKLLNAAATEIPQGAVQWVHHSILDCKTVAAKDYRMQYFNPTQITLVLINTSECSHLHKSAMELLYEKFRLVLGKMF